MVTADEEDKGADEKDKAEPADMVKPRYGRAPKEGGHNSNNLVAMAVDAAEDAVAYVAADAAEDAVGDEETDMATGSNQCRAKNTAIGTTAGHTGMMCRHVTTEKRATIDTRGTRRVQQNTLRCAAACAKTTR